MLNKYLFHRQCLINKRFVFTPETVCHIERVNRILTECTIKVIERSSLLFRQMKQLMAQRDDFLSGFMIEGEVKVSFNGPDSLYVFENDENGGESDYEGMAEVLEDAQKTALYSILETEQSENIDFHDHLLGKNFNIELLSSPELQHIGPFCYASHALFCDSDYSLSDIIRINDFWSEVIVTQQNIIRNYS